MAIVRDGVVSSCSSQSSYHVYLSFKHNNACKNFIDNLYRALMQAGILTFPNRDKYGGRRPIGSEMRKAIKESKISVVVFTEEFAYSKWCLDELVNILERKRTDGHIVFPVFYKVDPSHIRKQKENYAKAFAKLEEEIMAETGEKYEKSVSRIEKWKSSLTDAANLAGIVFYQGNEAEFITKTIHMLWDMLSRSVLSIAPYPVGMYPRVEKVILWLQDSSADPVSVIYGESGIGKTTMVKTVYDLYCGRFDLCGFIIDLGETEEGMNGLVLSLQLQRQVLKILKAEECQVYSLDDGYSKLKAFQSKKFLLVVDDVDSREQLEAVLGMQDCFFPGSKFIVITRNEGLTHPISNCSVFKVSKLADDESLRLFCWHAFGHDHPAIGYMERSKKFVNNCGGLPLALQVVGSSLHDVPLEQWEGTLRKLETWHDSCIQTVLKVGYESLQDDNEKDIFLEIACFFIGEDKDSTVNILDECDYYTTAEIRNLVDRCLLTITQDNKLRMHHLLQEMAKEVIRQEALSEPGKRSIIWHVKDALTVLQEETGTEYIEGLSLKFDVNSGCKVVRHENRSETHSTGVLKGYLSKMLCLNLLSWLPGHLPSAGLDSTSEGCITTDVFSKLRELKILHLKNVHLHGSYKDFPKKIKWLCWDEFQLHSIPSRFPLENVAVLEMPNSNMKQIWQGTKHLESLKTLNLSHSHSVTVTPDLSGLPNLERLIFEDCINLIKIHNSIGNLHKLLLLDLRGCVSLRKLPRVIKKLKSLEKLFLSGSLKLECSMTEIKMSLPEHRTDGSYRTRSRSTFAILDFSDRLFGKMLHSFCWSRISPCKSRNVVNSLLNLLPLTLVSLDLSDCNLSEKAMSTNLSILPSLRYLNLSRNPISKLPESIKGLTSLQSLELVGCGQLQSLPELPSSLKMLYARSCRSLKKITNLPNLLVSLDLQLQDCGKLIEVQGLFKLIPIRNIQEMLSKWGLMDLNYSRETYVELINCLTFTKCRSPLMTLHEFGILNTFIPGAKVPGRFKKTRIDEAIHIGVPCISNVNKYFVDICVVYETDIGGCLSEAENSITIEDKTKRTKWVYSPVFYAVKGSTNSILWFAHWNFGDQLEGGDQIVVSINMNFQVKDFGVHIIWDEKELDTFSRTTEKDIDWHPHFQVSGQHDASHLSAYQVNEGVYMLSHHP